MMIPLTLSRQLKSQADASGISCQADQHKIILGEGDNQIVITAPSAYYAVQCRTRHIFDKICSRYSSIRKNSSNLSFSLEEGDIPELVSIFSDACLDEFLEDKIFQSPIPESLDETESDAKVKIRKGQAYLRELAMNFWNNRCAITGIDEPAVLEACHIKPWSSKDMTARERLSVDNVIIMCIHLHRLFDAGLIGFDDSGKLLISSHLSKECSNFFALSDERFLRISPSEQQKRFLAYHRQKIFMN